MATSSPDPLLNSGNAPCMIHIYGWSEGKSLDSSEVALVKLVRRWRRGEGHNAAVIITISITYHLEQLSIVHDGGKSSMSLLCLELFADARYVKRRPG